MAKDVIAADSTEDRRFREFFGVGVHVAIIIWTLLVQHSLLPDDVEVAIPHLLWAMYFLACYPTTEEGCAAAADPDKGAIDPKTWRKYVWPMIYSLSDLESVVVSSSIIYQMLTSKVTDSPVFQIDFESRKLRPTHDTHLSVDCTDCHIQQKGPIFASHKLKKSQPCATRLPLVSSLVISNGSMVHIRLESTRT